MKNLISLLFLVFILFSCNKKSTPDQLVPIVEYPNFANLKTGNSWIYERYEIKSNGTVIPLKIYDSCYVEKDTLMGQSTYFKMIRPLPWSGEAEVWYVRDSLHYIVNHKGEIIFSSEDFNTTFTTFYHRIEMKDHQTGTMTYDTVAKMETQMIDKDYLTKVPYGFLKTSNYSRQYKMFPKYMIGENPRYEHTRYAKDIGIVTETFHFYASNPDYLERRLVRVHKP
jgi:hypothetical protein